VLEQAFRFLLSAQTSFRFLLVRNIKLFENVASTAAGSYILSDSVQRLLVNNARSTY